jgi:CheY-like chemotaxis protein
VQDDKTLHELGNLLAVIAGQAEFLLQREPGADRAETRASLEAILGAALRGRDKLRQARSQRDASRIPAAVATSGTSVRHILLVDDQEDVREAVAALLRQGGHRVELAGSGEDAMTLCERGDFDCVITDLSLPGLSGLTLSRVVKDRRADTYVILMTGSAEEFEPALVRAAGVDRLLFKPCPREDLLAAVADARPDGQTRP